jgi:hypothetical protein
VSRAITSFHERAKPIDMGERCDPGLKSGVNTDSVWEVDLDTDNADDQYQSPLLRPSRYYLANAAFPLSKNAAKLAGFKS